MECVVAADFATTKTVSCLSKCRDDAAGWDATANSNAGGCMGATECNGTSGLCECTGTGTTNAAANVCSTGFTCADNAGTLEC